MPAMLPNREQFQVASQVATELKPEPRPTAPPEQELDQGQEIQVKREMNAGPLGRLGMDEQSLQNAGVLRANQAQAAQDAARGLTKPGALSEEAQKRAQKIRSATPENIEPVNKRPV